MKSICRENIHNELYHSTVFLYGAGITCRRILKLLEPYPVRIKYIIDDDMNKWGTAIENIEIISIRQLEEMCKEFTHVAVILTTIYGKTVLKALDKIGSLEVYEMYNWLDEVYALNSLTIGLDDPEEIKKFGCQINAIKEKLADEESRRVYEGIYDYMCSRDSKVIPDICTESEQYFIPEVLAAIREPLNLVDGGAYIGELYQSVKKNDLKLEHWYCFEADADNYRLLLEQSEKTGLDGVQICIGKGLWDKEGVLYFDAEKNTVSRIVDYETENQIETISLNSYFRNKNCNFIKMDIEGAEYPALCGAVDVIRRDRPLLAISIYHSVEDYYRIPGYLMNELKDYRYYIRHHALILSETVLYAIPNERA